MDLRRQDVGTIAGLQQLTRAIVVAGVVLWHIGNTGTLVEGLAGNQEHVGSIVAALEGHIGRVEGRRMA